MLEKLFETPICRGSIEPTPEQLEATKKLLYDEYWAKTTRGSWALESGKSTGGMVGGKELFDHEEFDWMLHPVMVAAHDYWKWTINYRRDMHVYIDSMWANLHNDGDTTGEHCHISGQRSKSHVSIVYHLQKHPEHGHIQFKNPLEDILRMTPLEYDYDADSQGNHTGSELQWNTQPSKSFDYFIFPSWLKHRTQPAVGERIAISINVAGCLLDPTDGDFNE